MAVTRPNILASEEARDAYFEAAAKLGSDMVATASQVNAWLAQRLAPLFPGRPPFRLYGIDQELSRWDIFVIWHYVAMNISTSPAAFRRNLAHGGPIFLPWHRLFMIRLEQQLQRVGGTDAALPYWDWAAPGAPQLFAGPAPAAGDQIGQVATGPLGDMRVRLYPDGDRLYSIPPRRLERAGGQDPRWPTLPTKSEVAEAVADGDYDLAPWGTVVRGFRNRVEGWFDPQNPPESGRQGLPRMHNRVHTWIGGDMGPGTSPNDPLFYLNHCNADRIWEAWMTEHGRTYAPGSGAVGAPAGHTLNDTLVTLVGQPLTPADVLDPSQWYGYDSLDVAT